MTTSLRAILVSVGLLALSMITTPPATAAAPIRIAVFGDSVIWGQGLHTEQKFWSLYARDLETRLGSPVEVVNFSHSGSTLSYFHAGYASVIPGSCDEGYRIPGELPVRTPSVIECQIPAAAASGKQFDLALIQGCANDVGVVPFDAPDYRADTNVLTGSDPVATSVRQLCGPLLPRAVAAAHGLSGAPRVAVFGYYPALSRASAVGAFAGIAIVGTTIDRALELERTIREVAIETVAAAGDWAAFVPSGITEAGAAFTMTPEVFYGADDPLFAERTVLCQPYLGEAPGCAPASFLHPNAAGHESYRRSMSASPAIRAWETGWADR